MSEPSKFIICALQHCGLGCFGGFNAPYCLKFTTMLLCLCTVDQSYCKHYITTHFCSKIEVIVKSYIDGQILFGRFLRASWQPFEKCQTDSNRMSISYKKHSCSIPVGITLPQHLCISDQLVSW